jgi:hypothetical protein
LRIPRQRVTEALHHLIAQGVVAVEHWHKDPLADPDPAAATPALPLGNTTPSEPQQAPTAEPTVAALHLPHSNTTATEAHQAPPAEPAVAAPRLPHSSTTATRYACTPGRARSTLSRTSAIS